MKFKILALSILAFTLAACSSNDTQSSIIDSKNNQKLSDYNWHLVSGQDANQNIIPKLNNTPIKVNFSKNRMNFHGGCNHFMLGLKMEKKHSFKTNSASSTLMACESSLMELDNLVSRFFDEETIQYIIQGSQDNPQLKLTNSKNQTLTLQGSLTDEKFYNNTPETKFIEISSKLNQQCKTDKDCYQYRMVTYNDKYKKIYGEWQKGLPDIKKFHKNPDIREIVRVKEFNTPANGKIYVFDMTVEQEIVK